MRWHFSSELPAGDDLAEYIQGQDLQALPKPVPWQFALELAVGLARGLAAAHKRGVLPVSYTHLDVYKRQAIACSA